ncbi:MAG TPA: glycosyltransferase family 39 protein [Coriobacteriia bacterium]
MLTLARVHPVWGDEGSYSDVAMSFARRGTFAQPFLSGDFGFERSNVAFGRLYTGALGLVYRFFGVGVLQGRLLSFACGLAILALVYAITRELRGSRAASVWAAVLAAASYSFFDTTHTIRPEIMLTALAMCALYVLLVALRKRSVRLYAVAGLLAGACADVHSNGMCVPIAIALVVVWLLGWRRAFRSVALPFGLGAMVAAVWWISVHVLPDPGLFASQWGVWSTYGLPPAVQMVTHPITWIMTEAHKIVEPGTINVAILLLAGYWAMLLVSAAVLVPTWVRRENVEPESGADPDADRLRYALVPLVYLASLTFAMTLIVSQRLQPYYVYAIPMIASGAVLAIPFARRLARQVLSVVLVGAVVLSIGATGYASWKLRDADYEHFASQIRGLVPADARVFGWPDLRFAFLSDQLRGYTRELYERAPAGSFLVVGEDLDVASVASNPALHRLIIDRGELVGTVVDPVYGRNLSVSPSMPVYRTRVYRLK